MPLGQILERVHLAVVAFTAMALGQLRRLR